MKLTRRSFAAGPFIIVPRTVLGGAGYVAPSDRVTIATIGMGRQGLAVTTELMARPDVQMVAVCDCNRSSKDYAEYSRNSNLNMARQLLGKGFEDWAPDLATPGSAKLTNDFTTSLGFGGRDPGKRLIEAYYGSHTPSGRYKGCTAYADYRELLDKQPDLDAVYVATPDHWHAPIGIAAMKKGKHVLGQKPMTHSVGEARRMAETARQTGIATSVTVNNPSSQDSATIRGWIQQGLIGKLTEVLNWSSRPYWPQGVARPKESVPVPEGLDWQMWLGPAPERPYHPIYTPFAWRGWYDFGCGSFGDMGCYSFAGLFKILDLTPPTAFEASVSEPFEETFPKASIVSLDFPENAGRAAFKLVWLDGGLKPPRPDGLTDQEAAAYFKPGREGIYYAGTEGAIIAGFNGNTARIIGKNARQAPPVDRQAARRDAIADQWIAACKGGPKPLASFESQAAPTEAFLLGCIAQRKPGEKYKWDSAAMRVTNNDSINQYLDPPWRGNWT